MSDLSSFFDERTSEIISRPPTKIGEFDVSAAAKCVTDFHQDNVGRRRAGWPGNLKDIPGSFTLDVARTFRFFRDQDYLADFEPVFFLRQPGYDEEFGDSGGGRQWHVDEGVDPQLRGADPAGLAESIVGATPNVTRVLDGRLQMPRTWLDANTNIERAMVAFLNSDDGQESVESAITHGNLKPVEVVQPGDLALIPKGTIHAEPPGLESGLRFFSKHFLDYTVELTRS